MAMIRNSMLMVGAMAAVMSVATVTVFAASHSKATPESIIKERKAVMKEVVLKGLKSSKQMIKDDFFNAEEAAKHMTAMAKVASEFGKRFPKGTETGFETTVKPEIWTKKADFDAKLVKFEADAKAASAAAGKGFGDFKVAFKALTKNCGGCHKPYRIKKK